MSSKRRKTSKGASSSAPPSYDTDRFVSEKAFERYRISVTRRALIPERGMLIFNTKYAEIKQQVIDRKWGDFVKQPGTPAVVAVVREFYANAPERVGDKVFVRGKRVSFSRSTINRLYKVPNINDRDFRTLVSGEEKDSEAILQAVCTVGSTWKMNGSQILSVKQSSLSRICKAWLSFLSAKLLPVMHQTEVQLQRVVLLYAIITGVPIDVGSVIHNHILESLKGITTGGLGHTCLITDLCKVARVCWGPEEELLQPQRAIDDSIIDSFKSLISNCSSNAPTVASSSRSRRPLTITERLNQLEADVKRTLQQQHDEMRSYIDFQIQALTQLLSQASLTPLVPPPVVPCAPAQSGEPSAPHDLDGGDDGGGDNDDDDDE